MNIKEKVEKVKEVQKELWAENQKQVEAAFKDIVKDIFVGFPNIESFSWTQYTPYFNDGDECNFTVNTYGIKINDEDSYDNKEMKIITEFLNAIDDNIMESLFGDHVEICVYKDKIEISEYEHE